MPDPPDVSLFSRYVLENPWPLAIALLATAVWLAWSGMREGLTNRLRLAGALTLIGGATLAVGTLVVTSGEHAEGVTHALVDAAVKGDVNSAANLFATDAVFSAGSPNNPGFGRGFIVDLLHKLGSTFAVESNTITELQGFSETGDRATAHMACWTTLRVAYGPGASQWVVRVRRDSDGSWKITHLTCISVNNRPPPLDLLQ